MVRTSEKFCHLYYRWQEIEILQLQIAKEEKTIVTTASLL